MLHKSSKFVLSKIHNQNNLGIRKFKVAKLERVGTLDAVRKLFKLTSVSEPYVK